MLRSFALLATGILPAAFIAAPVHAETRTAERDGYRFEYSTSLEENDTVRIEGKMLDNGERFRLVVRPDGRVRGEFGARPVSFAVGKATSTRLLADLKTERALAQSGLSQGQRLSD